MSVLSTWRKGSCLIAVAWLLAVAGGVSGAAEDVQQQTGEAKSDIPKIADEPKAVDPATLMPDKLAKKVTVDFSQSSLREVLNWLREKQGVSVLVDNTALSELGVLIDEPISDRLQDAPIYLLLNRLAPLGLAWYYDDDIVHVTSVEKAEEHMTTVPYEVGDLLQAGYTADDLVDVIEGCIAPDSWEVVGGPSVLSILGDVMFVRQTDGVQREVQGLLAALRKLARQTFVLDPAEHVRLRQKMKENVSVDLVDVPLVTAVEQLSKNAQVDIRLDETALREKHVRPREPVTLKLTDRKLETILQALVANLDLTWMLRDGVVWITSRDAAESQSKTAVFDVRDLCRDESESDALLEALVSQTGAEAWEEVGGPGSVRFPQPGTLVVSNRESVLADVLDLLETYRAALRASRPRAHQTVDPQEVITVYYRLHENVAGDLRVLLPQLVEPQTWKGRGNRDAPGEILIAASLPEVSDRPLRRAGKSGKQGEADAQTLVESRAVLIVTQTRAAHDEIAKVIGRVQSGDATGAAASGGGGFGGGGRGFGGAYLSVPETIEPVNGTERNGR